MKLADLRFASTPQCDQSDRFIFATVVWRLTYTAPASWGLGTNSFIFLLNRYKLLIILNKMSEMPGRGL
jgi:hypothetical protein